VSKIEYYPTLEDKSKFFNQQKIENREQLDEFITKYRNYSGRYIFRGCTESKYKLYNSSQRLWITMELSKLGYSYFNFIKIEINNAKKWQNNLLSKFFNSFGQPPYDLSILSFLQHYGAPTPLLDWTYSFENSLFFATDGMGYANSDINIDNYCSIYIIDTKWTELINLLDYLSVSMTRVDNILKEFPKVDAKKQLSELTNFSYEVLHGSKLAYIPGYRKGGFAFSMKSRPSFNLVYNQQNLNIINQKGLFVFNNSEDSPLESFFRGVNNLKEGDTFSLPKIICLEIHKSLKEYMIKFLTERRTPINQEFIYPQEELIAKKAFTNFLNFNHL
jgi:hypothetical protein